jgi:hypothetical protein
MKFTKRQPYRTNVISTKQPDNTTNVKVCPIVRSFRIISLITVGSSGPWVNVGSTASSLAGFSLTAFPGRAGAGTTYLDGPAIGLDNPFLGFLAELTAIVM